MSVYPSQVALIVESIRPREQGPRTLDIVFAATEPALGRERVQEPGLEPHFVPRDQLAGMNLHPALGWQLDRIAYPGPHGYAAYLNRPWR